jgi:lipoprotein-anchoring transpeptidase ErfK/SrfK
VAVLALLALGIFGAGLYGVTTVATVGSVAAGGPPRAAAGRPATPAVPGSRVAYGTGPYVDLYATPDAPYPVVRMPNPWLLNGAVPIQLVFLVEDQPSNTWAQVLLPMRPDGLRGWIRTTQVRIMSDPWRIDISVGAHLILVHRGAALVYQGPVATGAPATPTPLGDYFIRVLLRSTDPASPYGPYAYGFSAQSDALTTYNGNDAELGLHGNDDPASLGTSVTLGAVRMDNAEITALAAVLPLGTPVHIGP